MSLNRFEDIYHVEFTIVVKLSNVITRKFAIFKINKSSYTSLSFSHSAFSTISK